MERMAIPRRSCPPWARLQMTADDECVLFSFSDAPLQEAAGILRTAEDER